MYPRWECKRHGEIVYDDAVAERLDTIIKQAAGMMTEIAVVEYTDSKAAWYCHCGKITRTGYHVA